MGIKVVVAIIHKVNYLIICNQYNGVDIERIIENDFSKNHFLGTIVFVKREIENLMTERVLIDGQQRVNYIKQK